MAHDGSGRQHLLRAGLTAPLLAAPAIHQPTMIRPPGMLSGVSPNRRQRPQQTMNPVAFYLQMLGR